MDYRIRFVTPTSGWDKAPSVVLSRDWTLKDFRKDVNRAALVDEALAQLGLSEAEVLVYRVDLISLSVTNGQEA